MAGEDCRDERDTSDSLQDYEVNVFNVVMDHVVELLKNRFLSHKSLFTDLQYFDPSYFNVINSKGVPNNSMKRIVELTPGVTEEEIQSELLSFASNFDILKLSLQSSSEHEASNCERCANCAVCALSI